MEETVPHIPKKKKKKGKLDSGDYWKQLIRLEKLRRSSEVKTTVVFSFHSLILGLCADRMDYFKALLSDNILMLIFGILWISATLISIFYCFKVFKPIIINANYDPNIFFFGDVASKFKDVDEYVKTAIDITGTDDKLFPQLAQQLHVESMIVAAKFKNVKKCIFYFMLSILFVILVIASMLLG